LGSVVSGESGQEEGQRHEDGCGREGEAYHPPHALGEGCLVHIAQGHQGEHEPHTRVGVPCSPEVLPKIVLGVGGVAYEQLLLEEDVDTFSEDVGRFESTGEVPIIRDDQRSYERLDKRTLRDLPAILDTFKVLDEEKKQWEREESERKAAQAKRRENALARERRKRKKLGEYTV
jgi:hypothetical protein